MIPPRLRLAFALLLTLVLFPLTRTLLPASADARSGARRCSPARSRSASCSGLRPAWSIAALQTAGNIVAQQLGLSFAMTVDPTMGGQQAAIGNFLTLLG